MNNTEPEDSERADGRRQRIERDGNRYQNNLKQVWVLPDDITLEIFCKLPIKTLTRCRCVCKSWRHSLSDSVFTQSLLSRPPACLFLDDRCRQHLYHPKRHILVDIEGLSIPNSMVLKLSNPNALYNRSRSEIIGSCNGFLCIHRFNNRIQTSIFNISNPITVESSISLPVDETSKAYKTENFGFGFSPIADVYKVVLFRSYREVVRPPLDIWDSKKTRDKKGPGLEVMVLTVGSGIWRRIGKVYTTVFTRYGVFHNGFLHWICLSKLWGSSYYIRAFDVETERFKDMPMPFCSPYHSTSSYIGVLKGSLSITFCSDDTFDEFSVWVMKKHGMAKSWTKELEIGHFTDWNGELVRRDTYMWWKVLKNVQVLKLFDEGEVLLFNRKKMQPLVYTIATTNLSRVNGTPIQNMKIVVTGHVSSFVSPKDIIRNYISKHPKQEVEISSAIEVGDVKMPAWTISVAGWGENEESELLEIPRGQPTPSLPLPEELKYVSSTTTTSLLDMIGGLNALLAFKCMALKDEIQRLRKENEDLRARARLPLEGKMPVQMIYFLMALIIVLLIEPKVQVPMLMCKEFDK